MINAGDSVNNSRRRRSTALKATAVVLMLAAGLACLTARIGRLPNIYDEGLTLVGADRILLGEVPYEHFWHTHPPGQIWITAGLFGLAGESMMVLRLLDTVLKLLLAISVWGWAARLGPDRVAGRALALVAFGLAVLWLEAMGVFGYSGFPALLCGLQSLRLVVRGVGSPGSRGARRQLAAAGMMAGVGALFRLDFGFQTVVAAALTLGVSHAASRDRQPAQRARDAVSAFLVFIAAAAFPLLLAAGVLVSQGVALDSVVDTLLVYPATVFPQMRRLAPPALSWRTLAFYVPAWIGVVGAVAGLLRFTRSGGADAGALGWFALSTLVLAAIPQARTRADIVHQLPVLLPSLALAAASLGFRWRRPRWRIAVWALLAPVLMCTYFVEPVRTWLRPDTGAATRSHGLSRAAGVALSPDQAAAVRAIRDLSRPGDFLFVANGRNNRSTANDALFYFLAGRRYPTFYHNMLPGLTTRASVQRTIVAELRAREVRWVVLCTAFDGTREPNASSEAGSEELDGYLRGAYVLSRAIGRYQIWIRR